MTAAWRLAALAPVLALGAAVAAFLSSGSSLVELIGRSPPQPDRFEIRRVELRPGEIRIRLTNPQPAALTIGSVTVDDGIVGYSLEGPRKLERLRSTTVVVPYDWVRDEPLAIGVISSSGIETTREIAAAVETPRASARAFLGYGAIGFLVGVLPVALGLAWLPSLARARADWLTAFMALTAGLLAFLGVDALSEAFERQALLPGPLGGAGLVLLGLATSYLSMTFLAARFALAALVALGIGLHNFGEGLAIGTSFAFGELALGTFLIVGFMVHNVTEGLAIAAPAVERRPSTAALAGLVLVAGAPVVPGAWLGGFVANDVLGVLFLAAAAGAAFEVVVEVGRYVARRARLTSGWAIGGFLAGIAVMYATGLLVG